MGGKKIVSLKEAVQEIRDRDVLFLGSFVDVRRPMAAAYEIVRQRKKGLILLAQSSLAEDLLVGAGCAAAWRGCYTGMASFGLSPATQRKIEGGEFLPDEIGHLDIILGAMAAMAGSPFVATRATLGSDVLNPAFSRTETINQMAGRADVVPRRKFVLMEDPFYGQGLVKLQPAMRADVAIFHVPVAGEEGTSRISGSLAFDHYFIHAARRVIVTAEQVVPEDYLRRDPNRNQIPQHLGGYGGGDTLGGTPEPGAGAVMTWMFPSSRSMSPPPGPRRDSPAGWSSGSTGSTIETSIWTDWGLPGCRN